MLRKGSTEHSRPSTQSESEEVHSQGLKPQLLHGPSLALGLLALPSTFLDVEKEVCSFSVHQGPRKALTQPSLKTFYSKSVPSSFSHVKKKSRSLYMRGTHVTSCLECGSLLSLALDRISHCSQKFLLQWV